MFGVYTQFSKTLFHCILLLYEYLYLFLFSTAGSQIAEQQREQQILLHQVNFKADRACLIGEHKNNYISHISFQA